ncbi:hypothetical protein [[Phormidium] sp. ETS-05]|uniref:hypothetical protein n=1 Tax=[Phormidium] sp. ETS-05 TaxID=222819 RepID=UPI0018EEEA0B|nr:hypothetical protein [[Phormidium] sp. ETS-05]
MTTPNKIMEYNNHPEFVGIENLKLKQKWQLDKFESWASKNEWMQIHYNHYDWWMFPVNQPSSYGFKWTIYDGEVEQLKQDEVYMNNYIRGSSC